LTAELGFVWKRAVQAQVKCRSRAGQAQVNGR